MSIYSHESCSSPASFCFSIKSCTEFSSVLPSTVLFQSIWLRTSNRTPEESFRSILWRHSGKLAVSDAGNAHGSIFSPYDRRATLLVFRSERLLRLETFQANKGRRHRLPARLGKTLHAYNYIITEHHEHPSHNQMYAYCETIFSSVLRIRAS